MKMTEITCAHCGTKTEKPAKEINRSRKLGRATYCSLKCGGFGNNAENKSVPFDMVCPVCGDSFSTSTRRRARRHCSRGCASKNSVTDKRREANRLAGGHNAENLMSACATLQLREAYKYVLLHEQLKGRPYQFEFELGPFVYDLALFDTKTLVEFDGPDHTRCNRQRSTDSKKNETAIAAGFKIERRQVQSKEVINPETIKDL